MQQLLWIKVLNNQNQKAYIHFILVVCVCVFLMILILLGKNPYSHVKIILNRGVGRLTLLCHIHYILKFYNMKLFPVVMW